MTEETDAIYCMLNEHPQPLCTYVLIKLYKSCYCVINTLIVLPRYLDHCYQYLLLMILIMLSVLLMKGMHLYICSYVYIIEAFTYDSNFSLDAIHLNIQATTASSLDMTAILKKCIFESSHETGLLVNVNCCLV